MCREYNPEVIFALRKSKVRQVVLSCLVSIYPKKTYASEIARKTGLRLNEVCGALNGSPKRYQEKNSLVALGLVRKEKRKNKFLYTITVRGCEVWKFLST